MQYLKKALLETEGKGQRAEHGGWRVLAARVLAQPPVPGQDQLDAAVPRPQVFVTYRIEDNQNGVLSELVLCSGLGSNGINQISPSYHHCPDPASL